MDLRQYVRVLREHWLLIAISVLVCTTAAGLLAWSRTPIYAAQSRLFVSNSVPAGLSEIYAGSLFTQQRVGSYALIVSSPPVVQAVIKQLNLPDSVEQLQGKIHASVPTGTVVINITAKDSSPHRAKAIADAVAERFATFVTALETPPGNKNPPVKVSITSPAELPTSPVSPKKPLYLSLGVLLGLVVGVGGAVLREAFTRRIRREDDAAAIVGAPVLGSVAESSRANNGPLTVLKNPFSAQAEAYRQLRTNLYVPDANRAFSSIVISSAVASEGKTPVVANLGIIFAQAGYRVVLVDANLRRPRLAEMMRLAPSVGLTNVLTENLPVEAALQLAGADLAGVPVGGLQFLASGPQPANPSELLGSQRFLTVLDYLTDRADLVILDAPALLLATDAAILARVTSGVVLVTRLGSTRVDQLEAARRSLRTVEAQILGLVVNHPHPRHAWTSRRASYPPESGADEDGRVAPELPVSARVDRDG
jgi:capsular exopolysaccharide synthesis family protein